MPTQLLTGERLALPPLRRHWILLVRNLSSPALTAALAAAMVDVVARGLLAADVRLLLNLAIAAPYILSVIVVWLRWEGDSLTVTDQRVVLEEGVFQRVSKVIPLNRVQDVSTAQTTLGRILDYGTVEIDAAGASGAERFAYVRGPMRVRDQVSALVARSERAA
ncbi:MAG TPA: PH domain-containing protein [Terriglobales bacterium]|nr:PH domain-containing protein [Terriglobales bacterium]